MYRVPSYDDIIKDSSGSNLTATLEDNVNKLNSETFADATVSEETIVPVQQYMMCSICTKSVKHKRVSCAKCEIQWCAYCYIYIIARAASFIGTTDGWTVTSNLQSAYVRQIRCPNCRMLYHKSIHRMCL